MIDSKESGAVVDKRGVRPSELVVEGDAGGEAEEALKNALSEPRERSSSKIIKTIGVRIG